MPTKLQNLRGQSLLFRCLETGFVTTAPALGRYQSGRGIDPSRRELVGERPDNWVKEVPTTVCEHCGMVVKGTQWTLRQHQQTKRCQRAGEAIAPQMQKEQVLKEMDGATKGVNVKTYKGSTISPKLAIRVAKANPLLKQSARD